MKNNSKTFEDMVNTLAEIQNRKFVEEFYQKGNIKTFINEVKSLNGEAGILNNDGKEITKREEEIIHMWGKFQLLQCLFETKKFMNSKKDITYVGKLLVEMGEKCVEIGGMK